MNAESEMAGADGLGGEPKADALDELAREIGYSDGADSDDEGGVDALIDYKNALEDRCRRVEEQARRVTHLWSEGEDVGDAIAALATACEVSD